MAFNLSPLQFPSLPIIQTWNWMCFLLEFIQLGRAGGWPTFHLHSTSVTSVPNSSFLPRTKKHKCPQDGAPQL
jgi:hypothetical protein